MLLMQISKAYCERLLVYAQLLYNGEEDAKSKSAGGAMRNTILDPPTSIRDDIRKDVANIVLDPERWLITPNDQLGGREPIDLLNSGAATDQQRVRDLIESIKHGMFT